MTAAPCPHGGYVVKGTVTFTFADHTEVFEAGDAFYLPPSHSPAEQVNAIIQRNMEEMQNA